jgi:MFS family permease
LAVLVVMGAGGIMYVTTINAMVQMAIPDELRGRVTSLFSITMTLFPVGMFVGGVLAAATTNEISIMTSGVGVALPVLLVYAFSRRFREMA